MIVAGFILLGIIAVLNSIPLAFFGMLFLGDLGVNLSFVSCLAGAIAVKFAQNNVVRSSPI